MNRGDRHATKRGDPGEGLLAEIHQLRPPLRPCQFLQVGPRNKDRWLGALEDHAPQRSSVQLSKHVHKGVQSV
jgi:hypothetical protein